jgi:hypothetical protein
MRTKSTQIYADYSNKSLLNKLNKFYEDNPHLQIISVSVDESHSGCRSAYITFNEPDEMPYR